MKRSLPLILITSGVLILAIGFKLLIDQVTEAPLDGIRLPSVLADLQLADSQTGLDALRELTRLHGRALQVSDAWSGTYGSEGQIQLWVARAQSTSVASRLLAAMNSAIAEGRSPFTPVGENQRGDRVVYELVGMGQRHYYFQSADLLIWLAAGENLAEKALRQVLEIYP